MCAARKVPPSRRRPGPAAAGCTPAGSPRSALAQAGAPGTSPAATSPVVARKRTGQLRALALGARQRLAAFPDVPTFAALTSRSDLDMAPRYGFRAPAGTRSAIVARLSREWPRTAHTASVRQRIEIDGGMPSLGRGTERCCARARRQCQVQEADHRTRAREQQSLATCCPPASRRRVAGRRVGRRPSGSTPEGSGLCGNVSRGKFGPMSCDITAAQRACRHGHATATAGTCARAERKKKRGAPRQEQPLEAPGSVRTRASALRGPLDSRVPARRMVRDIRGRSTSSPTKRWLVGWSADTLIWFIMVPASVGTKPQLLPEQQSVVAPAT